jgi:hypothetical protein
VIAAFVADIITPLIAAIFGTPDEGGGAKTRPCPFCASEIALTATRCPFCTSQLEARAAS